jgi:hypothetical protein
MVLITSKYETEKVPKFAPKSPNVSGTSKKKVKVGLSS